MRRTLPVLLLLSGFGPFTCEDPQLEDARRLLDEGKPAQAIEALPEADAPEVHFARAVAELSQGKAEEGRSSLDQVQRGLADRAAEGVDGPWAALQARLAFARGLVALKAEDWPTAQVELLRALALNPEDEDARWNLELAWYHAHPPCPLREDDHEPDNTHKDAPPWAEDKSKERLLCPANEDWYRLDLQEGAMLYAGLTGEIIQPAGEVDQTREVHFALYAPEGGAPVDEDTVGEEGAQVGVDRINQTGAWALRVWGPGHAEFKYTVRVDVVPPCPVDDKLEENDSAGEARALEDGQQAGLKACPSDPDWYKIAVPAKEGRQVTLLFDPERGPLAATITDEIGLESLAEGRAHRGGIAFKIPAKEEAQTVLLHVATETEQENLYAINLQKSDDQGKNQPQDQDKQDQDKQDQPQDQDKQDKDKQEDQKDEPKPKDQQEQQMKQITEALDEQSENPQLKKALKQLKVLPELEDY
ncbi:hypothetical protein KKB55_18730 [Myxococcota bacterium]|nr:hypothetical protein [Myxococcota bacterium]MBU1899782.1 hypothetical protein [Myxococcota bacterium]